MDFVFLQAAKKDYFGMGYMCYAPPVESPSLLELLSAGRPSCWPIGPILSTDRSSCSENTCITLFSMAEHVSRGSEPKSHSCCATTSREFHSAPIAPFLGWRLGFSGLRYE